MVLKVRKNIDEVQRRSQNFLLGRKAKPKITRNDVIKIFSKRGTLLDKDTAEWSIRSRGLGWHVSWILQEEKELEPKVKKISKIV